MKKGEIWWINYSPAKGSEQSGRRPAVVVSGNILNTYAPVIYVCPITTEIKNYKGDIVLEPTSVNGLNAISEVLIMHLRSVSKNRFEFKIGEIDSKQLDELRTGIQDLLLLD
ncbi:MAG: mRNA interferase MazF [Vicingaceae bacterium]